MVSALQGFMGVVGRVLLCGVFFLSAVGNKIPHFQDVAAVMEKVGVPVPQLALSGAIAFLIVGSVSIVLGLWARIGAVLLLVFLVLATYYFHAFWLLEGEEQQAQMIQFLKNGSLMGAMLMIVANGPGHWSIDSLMARRSRTVRASTGGEPT